MRKNHQKKSVLIIRASSLGDIVLAIPLTKCIKRSAPRTHITWLVQPEFKDVLLNNPDIDNVLIYDRNLWKRLLKKRKFVTLIKCVLQMHKELKGYHFDTAIDLQAQPDTGLLAMLSGALHRIGLSGEDSHNWFLTKRISKILGDRTQVGSEYRYLANQLGYSDSQWEMNLNIPMETRMTAGELVEEKIGNSDYLVICPTAATTQQQWFTDYWQQVTLRLRGRYQLRTLILGDEDQWDYCEKIARVSGATNLAGKASAMQCAAIIDKAQFLIGVDTELTHLGHALSPPTVALFGASHPYAYGEHEKSSIIYLDRYCSPCKTKPTCKKQYQCMKEITPDKVLTEIKSLLKRNNKLKSLTIS
ncbi:MAG: lipopolysaccharide heptosyltransferase [Alteromonadaceae bacterium]|nr:MAG: lipopolysaccharide heptosyltransferase [Alteromonadaceae bacterium]